MERSAVAPPTALDAAQRDVPTCAPDEAVSVAASRAEALGWETCVVVNDHRVVLGRLRGDSWRDEHRRAEDAMEEGPTTTRADDDLHALVERMATRKVAEMIVTDPDGHLLGVVRRGDAERFMQRT